MAKKAKPKDDIQPVPETPKGLARPLYQNSENLIEQAYTGSAEQTYSKSPMVAASYKVPYNTDDLWQRTGDFSIYEDMLNDDQVSVCSQLKKDLIVGAGHDFISEEDGQEDIVEELKKALDDEADIPLQDYLDEIMSAYDFGFSLTEKVFKSGEEGKLRLKCLKTRHPNSWLIHQDDKGNILKYEQHTSDGPKNINPEALIHYVNNRKWQNPYGNSDLRKAYTAWFAKRQVVRFFAVFLENAAGAKPVAKIDKSAPEGTSEKIFNTIKNLQAKTAMVIPKEIELEFLEAKSNGEAYSKAIDIFNMFIGRSLLIPDLLGFSGSETSGGSYDLGKEQIKIFFMHINRRRAAIERIINKHLVWPIVLYNFGYVENYPKFRFKPLDDNEAAELAKTWLEAVKGKVYKPNEEEINYFRKLVKFPEGDVEFHEEAQIDPKTGLPVQDGLGKGKEIAKDGSLPKDDKEKEKDSEKKTFGKIFDLPKGDYHKKVNFKAIKTKLDDYDQSIINDAQKVINKIFSDLYDQIEKKKIIKDQKIDRIESLSLKYKSELKQLLKNSFMQLYRDSQSQAASELNKANFRAPITSEKFLEILESETFQYVGDWEYKILAKTKAELIAAIKDGKPLSSVLDILDDEGKAMAESSIDRYARTKHTEVLNKGRHAYFEDSGVVAAYQYSAVLDDRTSDVCSGLHGKIFKAGDEPIPPLHFNCRSVLIPVTKYEDFEPTESIRGVSPDEFIDENKGEGFAVK